MNVRPSADLLADRIALALIEHGPTSCERLARIIEARTATVRAVLRTDERFERAGAGRGSRWRLALDPHESPWDGWGRIPSEGSRQNVAPRLAALERRVTQLERQLIEVRTT